MNYESQLLRISRQAGSVVSPVCWESEGNYLQWLATTAESGRAVPVLSCIIHTFNPDDLTIAEPHSAQVITKNFRKTLYTSLVIACESRPELEGFLTNDTNTRVVMRPFCSGARYDTTQKFSDMHRYLTETLGRVELQPPPATDALTLLLSLIALNKLDQQLGVKFRDNIKQYSEWAKGKKIIRNNWEKKKKPTDPVEWF